MPVLNKYKMQHLALQLHFFQSAALWCGSQHLYMYLKRVELCESITWLFNKSILT